jgi:hypothetical protein
MDNHLTFGKVHPLAKSTTYNIRDIARIPIRLKIVTENYYYAEHTKVDDR